MQSDIAVSATQRVASMALDALSLRHQVLANNIANVHSEGYQPLRLNFEEQLGALRSAVVSGADAATLTRLADEVAPFIEPRAPDAVTGDPAMRLDEEIRLMVQNTLQYEALTTALGRDGALMRLAVSGDMR